MRFAAFVFALAGAFAGHAMAQTPTVGGLLNNYSYTLPGLPNYGIAQGSIFAIFGTNLASTALGFGPPLQSSVNGISIDVTVNGTTTHPLFYYISPSQINAVLPSATPAGTGTITVTTSAGASAAFPIQVVTSSFGLLTTNNGSGTAQGFDANNNGVLFGFAQAVNPGEILELWGTGLGPVADDATLVPVTPTAQVYIGGVSASVQYAGRSGYTGLDQINVQVPAGISGCYVSVWVQTGTTVSNFGTIPVAANGRTCTDSTSAIPPSVLTQAAQTGTLSLGFIGLVENTTPSIDGFGGGTTEQGVAGFFKITSTQLNSGASPSGGSSASLGSCVVNFYNATTTTTTPPTFKFTYLNAGPDVNINGPGGLIAMPLLSEDGIDIYVTPSADSSFIPASGGAFSFNNGSGGPDVGPFTAQLQMAAPVTWSNASALATITRANGVTVNWTGGDPSSYVTITGTSFGSIDGSDTSFVVGDFTCEAPASPGTFYVPAAVLQSLPASFSVGGVSSSTLALSNISAPVTFSATGIDIGYVISTVENTINVTYQ